MRNTNNAYGCISSTKEEEVVYFDNQRDMDAFNRDYVVLVEAYNKKYHSYK